MTRGTRWPDNQADRVWPRIVVEAPGCWIWTGQINPNGYGRVLWNGRKSYVHRVVWELLVGTIADGRQLDHLCRVRACCNPDHLEPVTQRENILRGAAPALLAQRMAAVTHCSNGHEFTRDNTLIIRGARRCRTCNREQCRRQRAKRQPAPADWSPDQLPAPRHEQAS